MPIESTKPGEIVVRIPPRPDRPYDPRPRALYTPDQLMEGWETGQSLDQRTAEYYTREGSQVPKNQDEALCQRIHDDFIDRLVLKFVEGEEPKAPQHRKIVGIMGGHAADRNNPVYAEVAKLGFGLTQAGYCVLTGGGPGVMEGANLGAYMSASYSRDELKDAVVMLGKAPSFPPLKSNDKENAKQRRQYVEVACAVRKRYPNGAINLGIPTWAYADEPTGQFATHIAKYFANSIREDGLLAIASHGVVFAPGAAGTSQEIFQDACHNSYWTFGYLAPMVFLGSDYYRRSPSLYDVALAAANRDGYSDYLALLDTAEAALAFINAHPPTRKRNSEATIGHTGFRREL
jgi:predicted Rossmann-fold nucleotide-binding protein